MVIAIDIITTRFLSYGVTIAKLEGRYLVYGVQSLPIMTGLESKYLAYEVEIPLYIESRYFAYRSSRNIVYDASYYNDNKEAGYTDYTKERKWMSGIVDDIEAIYGSVGGLDILDVGCAFGYLTNELSSRGANVIGIDFSNYAITQAQGLFPLLDFRQEDVTNISLGNNSVDIVVAMGLFDCLLTSIELQNAVTEIDRILRQGGKVYILTSRNSRFYATRSETTWFLALGSIGGLWFINDIGHLPLKYQWRIHK